MFSLNIDYKSLKTDLCDIGAKYDTDKSSQRQNVTSQRHCHPYTLFYDYLFKNNRDSQLKIAELGILDGASLLMWKEYFKNAKLYGFEYSDDFINNFKTKYDTTDVVLSKINVNNEHNIVDSFESVNEIYDLIIEDTTHQFEDQIRVIKNVHKYLKPGGILIIEDIFKKYNEADYTNVLSEVLGNFQEYYFISLDHERRNSTGWDNDKLFVLVKHGEPIFKQDTPIRKTDAYNEYIQGRLTVANDKILSASFEMLALKAEANNMVPKLSIITPCYRQANLTEVFKSIRFDLIDKWYIVYDTTQNRTYTHMFTWNPKIVELECSDPGISGNPQRNMALKLIDDGLVYFVDDDNIIHPGFWEISCGFKDNMYYTFDQLRNRNTNHILKGGKIQQRCIDTAQYVVHKNLIKDIEWNINLYEADYVFISKIHATYNDKHVYIPKLAAYYNYLRR